MKITRLGGGAFPSPTFDAGYFARRHSGMATVAKKVGTKLGGTVPEWVEDGCE
jgi:hypothetical protein